MDFTSGKARTEAAIEEIWRLACDGAADPRVIDLTSAIIHNVRDRDQWGELHAIFRWHRRNMRYFYHPVGVQLLQSADYTLFDRKGGDCAAATTALAAMGMSVGIPAAIKTVAANKAVPDDYSHVYPIFYVKKPGAWIAADPVGGAYIGWEPPEHRILFSAVWQFPVP